MLPMPFSSACAPVTGRGKEESMAKFTVTAEAVNASENATILSACYSDQCQSSASPTFEKDDHTMVTCVYQASKTGAMVNFFATDEAGNKSKCARRTFNPANPIASFAVCVTLLLAFVLAQPPARAEGLRAWAANSAIRQYSQDRSASLGELLDPNLLTESMRNYAARQADPRREIIRKQVDKHIGGSADSAGSTNLVSKAGTAFLSAAFSNGAFTSSRQANTTTLRANALKVAELFRGTIHPNCPDPSTPCTAGAAEHLKGLSFQTSFENTDSKVTPVTTQPTSGAASPREIFGLLNKQNRLTSWGGRYEFTSVQKFDGERWKEFIKRIPRIEADASALAKSAHAVNQPLSTTQEYKDFEADVKRRFAAVESKFSGASETEKNNALVAAYEESLEAYVPKFIAVVPQSDLKKLNDSLKAFISARNAILDATLFHTNIAFEAAHLRPSDKPEMVNTRLIITHTRGNKAKEKKDANAAAPAEAASVPAERIVNHAFSLNLASTFYPKPPAGKGAWRDVQGAAEWERFLGPAKWQTRPSFSSSVYYQYMVENSVIEFDEQTVAPNTRIELTRKASEILDTKGHIVIVQARLTIPLGNSGLALPVAVSYGSRNEFVPKSNDVRGHFGLTLDIDKLVDSLKK